jgi:hypothetical protein
MSPGHLAGLITGIHPGMTKICVFMFCKHAEIMNHCIAARAFRVQ